MTNLEAIAMRKHLAARIKTAERERDDARVMRDEASRERDDLAAALRKIKDGSVCPSCGERHHDGPNGCRAPYGLDEEE